MIVLRFLVATPRSALIGISNQTLFLCQEMCSLERGYTSVQGRIGCWWFVRCGGVGTVGEGRGGGADVICTPFCSVSLT